MIRQTLALARLPLFATVVAVVALLFAPGRGGLVLTIYLLALGAFTLAVLLGVVHRASRAAPSSPFERALRRRASSRERLPDLERLERELSLASQTAADLHFRFRPRLRRIAARLLAARRGIDLDANPAAARRALGDELWELVRPDREAPRRRDAAGPLCAPGRAGRHRSGAAVTERTSALAGATAVRSACSTRSSARSWASATLSSSS